MVSAPPDALDSLRHEIDLALDAALDAWLPRLGELHPDLAPLGDELRGFVAGGKRLRPVLLLLGFAAAGGTDRRAVHGPALALELVHTCALIHDDVIDQATTRRGRPSVHTTFATRHRERHLRGDADQHGQAVAILAGGLAFVAADAAFLEARVPAEPLLAAFRWFTTLREEVTAGQVLDLHAAATASTDRELALAIATLKSGRYTVTRPLQLGAVLAGANDDLVDGLERFGEPLGRAFQLRDDLLGVFGASTATGKSTSSDLAEGKRTLLVAEAFARLDHAGRSQLEAGLGDPHLDLAGAERLRELLTDSGARAAVEDEVRASVATARTALRSLRLPVGVGATLEELAGYLVERSS